MATSPAASSASAASPYYRKQFRLKEPLVIATSDTESDSGSASADSPSLVGSSSAADHWHAALRHLQRHEQFTSGAAAVRHVAANTTDTVFLYPLLAADANTNDANTDNRARQVTLEIRAGAADAVRGALAVGTTASALIPSQTLPLFLPNLFAIAQAGQPAVFHVACEALSKDLAVGSSYEAVYALQHAGGLLLNASSPQELHDLSVVAHVSALRLKKLVVHFFDGARVAKEHAKINVLSASSLQALADLEAASAFAAPVSPAQDIAAHVQGVMDDLFPVLQTQYNVYEYFGSPDAEHLVVVVGEASASLRAAVAYEQMLGRKVGVVQVRLLLPWSHALFAAAVPVATIKRVAVLENVSASAFAFQRGLLSQNVQAFFHAQNLDVQLATGVYGGVFRNYGFSVGMGRAVLARLADGDRLPRTSFLVAKSEALYEQALSQNKANATTLDVIYGAPFESSAAQPFAQQFVFWRKAVGANDSVDHATLELLTRNPQTQVHALATEVAPSESVGRHGVAALEVRVGQTQVAGLHQGVEHADVVVVDDVALLKHVDVAAGVKPNGTLLVHCNWKTIDDVDESPAFKAQLAAKNATLLVVDLEELQTRVNDADIANVGAQVAFLKAANLYDEQVAFALLQRRFRKDQHATLRAFVAAVWGDVVSIVYPLHEWRPASYLDDEDDEEAAAPADESSALPSLASLAPTKLSFQTSAESLASRRRNRVSLATQTAWKFVFRDAFASRHGVRDHVTDLVRVTKWERLTPETYERNVFHVEMDIAHSAIKYNIGEALAVFAHNDEHAVLKFLRSYNVDPDALVVLPVAAKPAKKGHAAVEAGEETLTYFQLFAQVLDIFGRPSKKFYQALLARATSDKDKETLALLLDNDGKDEYKRRVDETLTYADLLDEFVSARPSMDELVHLVPRIKPRHYSIASSMKMNPTSVHLLIVVHDWTTPSGVYKIGQATRFLSQVKPGQMLSVSVCSSVMKLPVNHADPIIMAGLGTGMAPFRAFIQERAFLKSKGVAVGPIALYFGARSKAQEFLYGEELEQYVADGLLTHLRCAFSRDQAHKIYIQDRIAEDKALLGDWLLNKNAHFYLCGPTWPVADVREALVGALMDEGALERKQANAYIERMREQGRYVLEVY